MIAILLDAAEPCRSPFADSSSLLYQHSLLYQSRLLYQHSYASLWRSRP